MNYCANPFSYRRRQSREVKVGNVGIGGDNPIRVQSMITCDTMDTEASIGQTIELAEVGCEIVRITAPTVKDAANLQHIVRGLRDRGLSDASPAVDGGNKAHLQRRAVFEMQDRPPVDQHGARRAD